jgi:hypothetical protein
MRLCFTPLLFILATLSTQPVLAQAVSGPTSETVKATSSAPVAYVYVSWTTRVGVDEIDGFAAASNGKLTPISGSPFVGDVTDMVLTGKYLYGIDANGADVDSFSIASDGALKKIGSVDAQRHNGAECGGPISLFLDHTGSTLYDLDIYGNICANNTYQFFSGGNSGKLAYLGATSVSTPNFETPLSFTANNAYAYGSGCYHGQATIYGFARSSNGKLTELNINPPVPTYPKAGYGYCPYFAAADPTNHVAISLQENEEESLVGTPQLATYTVGSGGKLTTTSTYKNMPFVSVGGVNWMKMAPSGKLLAVGGAAGLQIFHFDGSSPITHDTGQLTKDPISQIFWDNHNHVYAISQSAGKLFVFTATTTSVSQAPGSPYSISKVQNLIVQPNP